MSKNTYLIIGGTHKAGTTSLYTYLSFHPSICASSIKETHYFSVGIFKGLNTQYDRYDLFFQHCQRLPIKLEASPEYLQGGKKIALKIKNYFGKNSDIKILFILRDPVGKIVSSFRHRKKRLIIPKEMSFNEYFKLYLNVSSIEEIADSCHEFTRNLIHGCYIKFLPYWFEVFNKKAIKICFFDDLTNNPLKLMENICNWLNIDYKIYCYYEFAVENKSINYRNQKLHKLALMIYDSIAPIMRKNYRLKSFLRSIYYKFNVDRSREEIPNEILDHLSNLYNSYNTELAEFLNSLGYTTLPNWLEEK